MRSPTMEFRRISFLFSIPFCTSFRENNMNLSNALPPQITDGVS